MDILNDLYGNQVIELANNIDYKYIANPDLIVTNSGVSCGDRLVYRVAINNDKIDIEPEVEACLLVKASLAFLLKKLNKYTINTIRDLCLSILNIEESLNNKSDDIKDFYETFMGNDNIRQDCIKLPWKTLLICLDNIANMTINREIIEDVHGGNLLECDACVATSVLKVNQSVDAKPEKKRKLVKPDDYIRKLEQEAKKQYKYNINLFGKVVIDEKEIHKLKNLCENWDDKYLQLLIKNKSAPIVYEYILKYYPDLMPSSLSHYVTDRKKINIARISVWNQIKNRLNEKGIHYTVIKGISNNYLYEDGPFIRDFNDVDVIVKSMSDYIKIASLLIYEYGFDFDHSLGGAGSFKLLSGEHFSGHAHFERTISENNVLAIDVAFPNIPLDKNNYLDLSIEYNNIVSPEDAILIALTHIFKHSKVPTKDINDIYLIFNHYGNSIDWKKLNDLVFSNHNTFKALIVKYALIRHYYLNSIEDKFINSIKGQRFKKLICRLLVRYDWPFSRKTHMYALLLNKYYYIMESSKANKTQIESPSRFLNSMNNKRKYFVPIISFSKKVELSDEKLDDCLDIEYEMFTDNVYIIYYENIEMCITEFGMFLFVDSFTVDERQVSLALQFCHRYIENKNIDMNICKERIHKANETDSNRWIYS